MIARGLCGRDITVAKSSIDLYIRLFASLGVIVRKSHRNSITRNCLFKSALDFDQASWEELAQAVRAELPYYPAVAGSEGLWGKKYEVILPITGRNGRAVDVLTVWIVRLGTNFPTFVTALVVGERK